MNMIKKAIAHKEAAAQAFRECYYDTPCVQQPTPPADCIATSQCVAAVPEKKACVPKKRNSAMYDEFEMSISAGATETERQKHFLIQELDMANDRQDTKLRRQFGLVDEDGPDSFEDLLARITAGKYVISDENKVKATYGGPLRYIKWRDPAIKEDRKGFDAAQKILYSARQDAERTIRISDPKEGLAALKSFESASFQ